MFVSCELDSLELCSYVVAAVIWNVMDGIKFNSVSGSLQAG